MESLQALTSKGSWKLLKRDARCPFCGQPLTYKKLFLTRFWPALEAPNESGETSKGLKLL
ncbi:MAG: hypothetical protein QW660_07945 [Candidatus Bathyarchaeia archaeon]